MNEQNKTCCSLTLIGTRGDTFISLSFLDQILSAEFLSKTSLEVKIEINQLFLIGQKIRDNSDLVVKSGEKDK